MFSLLLGGLLRRRYFLRLGRSRGTGFLFGCNRHGILQSKTPARWRAGCVNLNVVRPSVVRTSTCAPDCAPGCVPWVPFAPKCAAFRTTKPFISLGLARAECTPAALIVHPVAIAIAEVCAPHRFIRPGGPKTQRKKGFMAVETDTSWTMPTSYHFLPTV